jgi:hypothetical protein
MEVFYLIRALWRSRLVLAAGLLLAIAAGSKLAPVTPAPSGVASASVVIDTPRSELVNTLPYGAKSLPWRAATVSGLMSSAPVKRDIARAARVPPSRIAVLDSVLAAPLIDASLPKAAAAAAQTTQEPYVLITHADGLLPVVFFEAAAPTVAEAARLARAATAAVKTAVATSNTLRLQPIVIETGAAVQTHEVHSSSGPLLGVGIAVVLFALWCGCVLVIPVLARSWRATGPVARKAG